MYNMFFQYMTFLLLYIFLISSFCVIAVQNTGVLFFAIPPNAISSRIIITYKDIIMI